MANPDAVCRGRTIGLGNSAGERQLRAVSPGRRNLMFAGADRGGEGAAETYGLIGTAELNGDDPEAWLYHALEHIADYHANQVRDFPPWYFAD